MNTKINISLIHSCIAKDRLAQKELYVLLLPYLNVMCRRYLYHLPDVEDVLQEAFINIFRNIDKYDATRASFKTWITKIAINCCFKSNDKRKKVVTEELIISRHEQEITPSVLKKLSNEELLVWLKQLPEQYYRVFNLFVVEGFSHREIAEILSIDEAVSRKRLSRSKAWLKKNNDSKSFSEKIFNNQN